ncbi:hypothetical protein Tco_0518981 [Tanacetum coccineum]
MHENKSFNINLANHTLYHALMESLIEDENAMDKGVVDTIKNHKRQHDDDDDDDDEDPLVGPNQSKKTKRRRAKESKSSKKQSTTKETSKGKVPSESSKTSKSATTQEPIKEPIVEVVMNDAVNTTGKDVVRDNYQPQDTSEHKTYKTPNQDWFKQPLMPPTLDPKWNKRQVVLDLPEQPLFNQMVSVTKDPLSFNDLMATPINFSNVSVKKLHGYGHLKEIVVKRAYRQLYKFKECEFVDLHLNNIKDMLLLAVQHKLFHLNDSDIVDFIMALLMFTISLIIKRQLYTPSYKPPRVIYEDLNKQKRVMRVDELYKFSDGTLKTIRDELHHRILDFCLGYNDEMSRRMCMAIDKKRSELMVKLIDKHIRERGIIRNLELLVGARELEMDYKLMTRIV